MTIPTPSRRAILIGAVAVLAFLLPAAGAASHQPIAAPRLGLATPAGTPDPAAYARPEWLAEPAWLRDHPADPTLRVVALTPAAEFARGHVPGAVQVDWPALEVTDTADPSIARWQGEIEAALTALGIAPTDTVVVYDGGTLYAPRLWWILRQLGHADVRVLNGGLAGWQAAGGELATGAAPVGSAPREPYRGVPQPDVLAQLDEVVAALDDPGTRLVDARTAEEHAAGHIPGAVLVPFADNAGPDGRWKPAAELRARYAGLGVTPDTRVIPYCTTGVRSAATYFTLGLLGYPDIALFTGSWAEWSADPELPTTVGATP